MKKLENQDEIYNSGLLHAEYGGKRADCPWDGGIAKQVWLSGFDQYHSIVEEVSGTNKNLTNLE